MKILLKGFLFGLLLPISMSFSSEKSEKEVFKGNWTQSFQLKDGSLITHTPKMVSVGGMGAGEGLSMKSPYFNNMRMSDTGLDVKTNSTIEEFKAALVKSGLY